MTSLVTHYWELRVQQQSILKYNVNAESNGNVEYNREDIKPKMYIQFV